MDDEWIRLRAKRAARRGIALNRGRLTIVCSLRICWLAVRKLGFPHGSIRRAVEGTGKACRSAPSPSHHRGVALGIPLLEL